MRVTLEHREEASGLTGGHKDTYVDCTVLFSEEEKAIIQQRDLYGQSFSTDAASKLDSPASFVGSGLLRIIGVVMVIAGVITGIAGSSLGGPLFFIGAGIGIWGWLRGRKQDKRIEKPQQTISIKGLLSNPTFTVHAGTAAFAKVVDDEIQDGLKRFKAVIAQSAELKEKQTFEL
jgi:hypothetical protein